MPTQANFLQGCTGFIAGQLEGALQSLNADLAIKVKASGAPPVFKSMIGKVPATTDPYLTTWSVSSSPQRIATSIKIRAITFMVGALIPSAGDNTPMNFEMCQQVSIDRVSSLFDQDAVFLTPTIQVPGLGPTTPSSAEVGDIVDIYPFRMDDGTTIVRGWRMPYVLNFDFYTR